MNPNIIYHRCKLVVMVVLLILSVNITFEQLRAEDYLRLAFYTITDLFFLIETIISIIVLSTDKE